MPIHLKTGRQYSGDTVEDYDVTVLTCSPLTKKQDRPTNIHLNVKQCYWYCAGNLHVLQTDSSKCR